MGKTSCEKTGATSVLHTGSGIQEVLSVCCLKAHFCEEVNVRPEISGSRAAREGGDLLSWD